MLERFDMCGEPVTSLDLKSLLISSGVAYTDEVYNAVSETARLDPPTNPYASNCFILPGEIAVHLQPNENSPFRLATNGDAAIVLCHEEDRIADVTFPRNFRYNEQRNSVGNPYGSTAVLEGRGTLAFFHRWSCQYIQTRETCSFCFQAMADTAGYSMPQPSSDEVVEIIAWSLASAEVKVMQLTTDALFDTGIECDRYAELLRTIDERIGLASMPSEKYVYMTAPKNPNDVDRVFDAGAAELPTICTFGMQHFALALLRAMRGTLAALLSCGHWNTWRKNMDPTEP